MRRRRQLASLAVAAVAAASIVAVAGAAISVYTYFGTGVAWWNVIYEGPGTFGPRYYNRVYHPTGGSDHTMCLRYHYGDGSYVMWQCSSGANPFYAVNSSGDHLTANPAKAQCKYYFPGGSSNMGLSNVTCQTTVGLP